ncbi:hypothetical protein DFQ26_007496 [Actinomortierella ambigua]|nr:hypothetical protein DFQ26_007496 [Actinomortierella ambigua]
MTEPVGSMQSVSASPPPMAVYPRAKVDSSTQTEEPLPFTALLDRTLDRIEANVPLNLSAITFHIRRQHLSRIEQLESLLSENFVFRILLQRMGINPRHLFGFLALLFLYACRVLYKRNISLATNLCAVAYPAYCSVRTINSDPVLPPKGLTGLENATVARASRIYHSQSTSSQRSSLSLASARGSTRHLRQQDQILQQQQQRRQTSHGEVGSTRGGGGGMAGNNPGLERDPTRRYSRRLNAKKRMSTSTVQLEDSNATAAFSNSYSSGADDLDSSSALSTSWGPPSIYSYMSEGYSSNDSGSLTAEERMHHRMRRRWNLLMQQRKDKATRQWLAYWSIYGTVQVIDTWSSFLLNWIPGYNLGKLLFLWWAQRRGATLVFDYFQPLIQAKSKDGREVAHRSSRMSLRSASGRQQGEAAASTAAVGGSRSARNSMQILPSRYQQQQQHQHQLYEQQSFYTKSPSRRESTTFYQQQQHHQHSPQPYNAYLHQQLNQAAHHQHRHHRHLQTDESSDDQSHLAHLGGEHHSLTSPLQEARGDTAGGIGSGGSVGGGNVFGGSSSLFESGESVWSAAPASSKLQTGASTISTSTLATSATATSTIGATAATTGMAGTAGGIQTLESIYSRAEDGVTPTPQDFGSPVSLHQQLRQAGYRHQQLHQ